MKTVKNEKQLRKAIDRGGEVVPTTHITLTEPLIPTVPVWIRGSGCGDSSLIATQGIGPYMITPRSPDVRISDIRISGAFNPVDVVRMDGHSRIADRFAMDRVLICDTFNGVVLHGGPGAAPLKDFAFRDSQIVRFTGHPINMAWEMLRPRIERSHFEGMANRTSLGGLWMGLGILDGHVIDCTVSKVKGNGMEFYYPHGSVGGEHPAVITEDNPLGPGMTIRGHVISDCGGMGFSAAGCKRSNISDITVRKADSFAFEFVDEDPTPSDLNAHNLNAFDVQHGEGMAFSIDRIKGGQFSGLFACGAKKYGVQVFQSWDVMISGSHFEDCGERFVFLNGSEDIVVQGNKFLDGKKHSVYAYKSTAVVSQNTFHKPLNAVCHDSVIHTDPDQPPITENSPFTRGNHFIQ